MPKRGARLPIQVKYVYPPSERAPDGITATIACYNVPDAESRARAIAQRGGHGTIVDRDTRQVLSTFEPEEPTDA